jgi:predicted transposase/invertase (TIGR01784 family)
LLPELAKLKSTIVDIRCRDNKGRQFLVEMQMVWTDSFQSRVLYNACKAFSNQINRGDPYEVLSPVYSLNIINDSFSKQSTIWYHQYNLAHQTLPNTLMDGLSFIFIELPNFIPEKVVERKMAVLWLRFLKEINSTTSMIPKALLEVPAIAEAVEALKVSSYTKEELEKYEQYWDTVRLQKSYIVDAFKEGKLEGKLEERTEAKRDFTISLINQTDFSDEKIAALAGVDESWVAEIRKQVGK